MEKIDISESFISSFLLYSVTNEISFSIINNEETANQLNKLEADIKDIKNNKDNKKDINKAKNIEDSEYSELKENYNNPKIYSNVNKENDNISNKSINLENIDDIDNIENIECNDNSHSNDKNSSIQETLKLFELNYNKQTDKDYFIFVIATTISEVIESNKIKFQNNLNNPNNLNNHYSNNPINLDNSNYSYEQHSMSNSFINIYGNNYEGLDKPFISHIIPNISIFNYIKRLFIYSEMEINTLISASMLIDKLCSKTALFLNDYNSFR